MSMHTHVTSICMFAIRPVLSMILAIMISLFGKLAITNRNRVDDDNILYY